MNLIPVDTGGVLTFQQAMSGAVSPQYSATSPLYGGGGSGVIGCGTNNSHLTSSSAAGASSSVGGGGVSGGPTTSELDMLLEDTTSTASPTSTVCGGVGSGGIMGPPNGPYLTDTPTGECNGMRQRNDHYGKFNATTTPGGGASAGGCCLDDMDSPTAIPHERIAGVGSSLVHGGSSATIAQLGNKQRQRMRTSSMPAESRKVSKYSTKYV